MMNDFELRVLRTVREHGMLAEGESIVAGVSGGADSVALLCWLARAAPRLRLDVTAAHLNHLTRGTESDQDEESVRLLARRLGVGFVAESLDVRALAAAARRNFEEVAREARYAFLRRAADRTGAGKIAVGHTLDDQAETVLMRMLRGSGIRGLAGIYPVVDGRIIRPLIEVTRRQVLNYLEGAGCAFREDSSNLDLKYLRNRVRRQLLPHLRAKYNPRISRSLALQARFARELADYVERAACQAFGQLRLPSTSGVALNRPMLMRLHPAVRNEVVRLAAAECRGSARGLTAIQTRDALRILKGESGRCAILGSGLTVTREFDTVLFGRTDERSAHFTYSLEWPGSCVVPEAGVELTAKLHVFDPESFQSRSPLRVALDVAGLPRRLAVRNRLPGDRYGGPGHRKVKKMLINARVPFRARALLPMIVAGSAVVWIPGFAPPKSFRPPHGSRRCVLLECRPLRSAG